MNVFILYKTVKVFSNVVLPADRKIFILFAVKPHLLSFLCILSNIAMFLKRVDKSKHKLTVLFWSIIEASPTCLLPELPSQVCRKNKAVPRQGVKMLGQSVCVFCHWRHSQKGLSVCSLCSSNADLPVVYLVPSFGPVTSFSLAENI